MSQGEISRSSETAPDVRQMQTCVTDEAAWQTKQDIHAKLFSETSPNPTKVYEDYLALKEQPDMKQALHRQYLEERAVHKQSTGYDQSAHQKLQEQADQGFLIITPAFHKNS